MSLKSVDLNRKVFEVLASETRIDILRRLDARCMTITELSNELDLAKSTVHEHLSRMSDAGLVQKKDGTNKWTYYELTKKGKEILHPHKTTMFAILLSSSALALVGGVWSIYKFLVGVTVQYEKAPVTEEVYPPPPYPLLPQLQAEVIHETIHEPWYLLIGIVLILVSMILAYFMFDQNRTFLRLLYKR